MSLLYGIQEVKTCFTDQEVNELLQSNGNWIILEIYLSKESPTNICNLMGRLDRPLRKPSFCERGPQN